MHGLEEDINEKMFATRLTKTLELFFNLNFILYFKQKKAHDNNTNFHATNVNQRIEHRILTNYYHLPCLPSHDWEIGSWWRCRTILASFSK